MVLPLGRCRLAQRTAPTLPAGQVQGLTRLPGPARRPLLHSSRAQRLACQARSAPPARQDIDVSKVARRSAGTGLQETVLSPFTAVPLIAGVAAPLALGYGQEGALAGAALATGLRALQLLLLDQTVPFTQRRHTLFLPTGIELLMGEATFKQQVQRFAAAGKVLDQNTQQYRMIAKIAERVIDAVGKQNGGGYQKHVSKFKWEVVVVKDKVPNAFVLPGGHIVVFTGLIDIMEGKEDLMAAVIGHEVAHALARHSSEKLSLGLFVTLALNLGVAAANFYLSRQRQQQGGGGRGQQIPVGRGGGGPFGGSGLGRSAYGRGGVSRGGGSPLLNPQVLSIFTNLFLQLPFSRRAEAEADLIGMKLMGLAGYDPEMAPETFRRLSAAEGAMRKAMGGKLTALQCTHPRSENRVKMLEEELAMMREAGDGGLDRVYHAMSYFQL